MKASTKDSNLKPRTNSRHKTKTSFGQQSVSVFSFRDAEDFRKWDLSSTDSASWVQSGWPDKRAGVCAKLLVHKRRIPSECTGLILLGKDMLCSDWRNVSALCFNVYAGQQCLLHLEVNSIGKAPLRTNIRLAKGLNRCRIPGSALLHMELARMDKIRIEVANGEQESSYCISDISLRRLHFSDELGRIDARREGFSANLFDSLPVHERKEAVAECVELRRLVSKLKTLKDSHDAQTCSLDLFEKAAAIIADLEILFQRSRIFSGSRNNFTVSLWCSSLEKVHRERQLFSKLPKQRLTVTAARGESQGVQLVLLPKTALKKVHVSLIAELKGKDSVIPASSVTVNPVGYVKCEMPSYAVPRAGWWPDPILDYVHTMDLEAGLWQAYWLDIRIPADQNPGIYTGAVRIASDGKEIAVMEFKVKVRKFSLPEGLPYPIVTALLHHCLDGYYPETQEEQERWRFACYDMLLAHRINPDQIYRKTPPRPDEVLYKLEHGAGTFNIMYVGGTDPKPILELLKEYVPQYKKAGILDKAYLYGFDEVPPARHHEMIPVLKAIKEKYPQIPIMSTAYDLSMGAESGLDEYIDIWVPLSPEYERCAKAVEKARKRGKQVWWYICCVPKRPYANWFIEYPAMDARILMGFMYWQFKPQGFLYYSLALWEIFEKTEDGKWRDGIDVRQKCMSGAPLTDWAGYSWRDHNGDGTVIYPGKNGPLASTRLKNIRDGLEDYWYLKILSEAVGKVRAKRNMMPADWLAEADQLLAPDPQFIRSLTEFTSDYSQLLKRRERIGDLLDSFHDQQGNLGQR